MKFPAIAGIVVLSLAGAASVHAVPRTDNIVVASKSIKRAPAAQRAATEPAARPADIVVVPGTRPGQTGYIHYFVITHPDGEPESHVGLELPGDRIAWSFPGVGVTIVPFMKSGSVVADGKRYDVEHLYGLRPLRDDESLRAFQRIVADRVAWWIDQKTPYCDEERPSNSMCVSCLGFVLRVLYPGLSPLLPSLPSDFRSVRRNIYTTEDLLLYLAGVPIDVPREARLKRIAALDVPDALREELTRLASADGLESANASSGAEPRPSVTRARGRSVVTSPRRPAPKRGS
jgi:hypothetical protein